MSKCYCCGIEVNGYHVPTAGKCMGEIHRQLRVYKNALENIQFLAESNKMTKKEKAILERAIDALEEGKPGNGN